MGLPEKKGYRLAGLNQRELILQNDAVTLYYYPELDTSGGADSSTFEPYVGVSGSVGGFSPGAYVYYDTTLEVLTLEGSIGYSVALEPAGASLDFSAALGRADPDVGSSMTCSRLQRRCPRYATGGGCPGFL